MIKLLRAFAAVARDPHDLDQVFALADAGLRADAGRFDQILASVRAHEQGARALRERPRIGQPSLAELEACPPGSLGRAYAAHLRANGLDPAKLPVRPAHDERSYFLPHIIETHDVWHVVTGFGTDVAGELGLMAFYAAQSPGRVPLVILTAGLVSTIRTGMADKDRRFDAIAAGWLLGKRARPLFGACWSRLWPVPLAEVRRRFAVDPASVHRFVEETRVVEERPDHQQPPAHLPLPPA
jgi:ubiquinone biosynthesis protein Coq4